CVKEGVGATRGSGSMDVW
nr:immunoglobulin heavy chain junction region [Macaca mulatta]MOV38957.1 immunoglobulin heavy chain junction region [Macaca mulatta]MOV39132.1 immunoglobulin heavy chain junction region [Macaca mulatta]MOV39413.1 immunoglobulin heavy chain junction region [Macaca mulatta]MOV40436.1 immunoglobulin heavy chain junction region [Macaca mulatta]